MSFELPTRGPKLWLGLLLLLFLMTVVLPVIGVTSFYLEEDWRGAHALAKARAEIDATGQSLDLQTYLPAPVPDAENFGSLPIFQTSPDPDQPGHQLPTALKAALSNISLHLPASGSSDTAKSGDLPFLEKWTKSEKVDLPSIRNRISAVTKGLLPTTPLPANPSATDLLEILCPALADLRTQNRTRPLCLFPQDFHAEPRINISFAPLTQFITVAKVLGYEERLALYEGNSQLALDDLAVAWKMDAGIRKQPLLISGLVAIGLSEIQLFTVQQGLADHDWTDAQLAQIDSSLGSIDFLSNAQFSITGDIVVFNLPTWDYYQQHRWLSQKDLWVVLSLDELDSGDPLYLRRINFWLSPKGWFDLDTADYLRFHFLGTTRIIDDAAHRVYPTRQEQLFKNYRNVSQHVLWYHTFLKGAEITSNTPKRFAYAQVHLDEARIACRLERYRLAHGKYPATLEELIPLYGSSLPQDVTSGEPYQYQLLPDGAYRLYSIAWNQKDDGGKEADKNQTSTDAVDWVWPNRVDKKK